MCACVCVLVCVCVCVCVCVHGAGGQKLLRASGGYTAKKLFPICDAVQSEAAHCLLLPAHLSATACYRLQDKVVRVYNYQTHRALLTCLLLPAHLPATACMTRWCVCTTTRRTAPC